MSDSPKQHLFYHELLTQAIKEIGHTPILKVHDIPQLRIKRYLDLGTISIYWMLETTERNQHYIPIEVDLTNGLIGNRILLIKKGEQPLYDKVKNLADFRDLGLVGGMGVRWFDAKVWQINGLPYHEHEGNWEAIFKMLVRGRGIDYFARGINEITLEVSRYPELQIEQNLLFIYDRDFRFYLSKTGTNAGEKYKNVISLALKKAKESGLIDRLIRKYWGSDIESLNHAKRIKIYLSLPSEQ
ncbi:hypothetical protein [Colwellia piezophila]|uniref:hypothetical protein n=1 Tax=Colwellia piezophila TaxID=211668 RepID=UPI0012FB1D46|nr:hypothetical protein [Colwellia piezophila]